MKTFSFSFMKAVKLNQLFLKLSVGFSHNIKSLQFQKRPASQRDMKLVSINIFYYSFFILSNMLNFR